MASPLADLYQRYKTGTRCLEAWITKTVCLDSSLAHTLSPQIGAAGPRSSKAVGSIKLSTRQLAAFTDKISQTATSGGQSPPEIDSTIIILRDVIAGRREYQVWHEQRVQNKDHAYFRERDSHLHFVNVLCRMLTALKEVQQLGQQPTRVQHGKRRGGKAKRAPRPASKKEVGTGDTLVFKNIHGRLERGESPGETSPDPVSSNTVPGAPPIPKLEQSVEIELEKPDGEDDFALWCFLKDCHKVRLFLRYLWKDQADGRVSIQTAAEVTDSGFIMLSKAAKEFTNDYPHLANFDQVADHLQIRGQTRGGEVQNFSYGASNGQASEEAPEFDEAVDLLCIPAFVSYQAFRELRQAVWDHRDDVPGVMELSESNHLLNTNLRKAILNMGQVPGILEQIFYSGYMLDNFTLRMLAMLRYPAKQVSIDEIMHYQIYMDLVETRPNRTSELAVLYVVDRAVEEEILSYERDAPAVMEACKAHFEKRSPSREAALRFIGDVLVKESLEVTDPLNGEELSLDVPRLWPFFDALPVACGRAASFLMQQKYISGVLACRQNPMLAAFAHLYRASLEAGLLRQPWEDMEYVIEQVGATSLGLLGKPGSYTPVRLSARRFGMAFGISAAAYANERRHHRQNSTGRIPLPQTAKVCKLQDADDIPKLPWLAVMAERPKRMELLGLSSLDSMCDAFQQIAQKLISDPKFEVDQETQCQWNDCKKLDIIKLLELFKKQAAAEEPHIFFNLHAFAVQVAKDLIGIRAVNEPRVAALREARGLSKEFNMVEMVDEILWEAVESPSLKHSSLGTFARFLGEIVIPNCNSHYTDCAKGLANKLKESKDLFEESRGLFGQDPEPLNGTRAFEWY